MRSRGKRVCLLSVAQLANCPRMLKAADALSDAGYRVRVVSSENVAWSMEFDQRLRAERAARWESSVIQWAPENGAWLYLKSGVRQRASRAIARAMGVTRTPMTVVERAYGRIYPELVTAALAKPADVYYGFARSIAETAAAASSAGVPFALDLEDFYSAELEQDRHTVLISALVARLELEFLTKAAFLTAGSAAIADEYQVRYGVRPLTINNTFPLPPSRPALKASERAGLRLYWFSQTIGPNRGLENAIRAAGIAALPISLTLRGRAISTYVSELRELAQQVAPNVSIEVLGPAAPEEMTACACGYDVGLALEEPHVLNRELSLSNKALTYVLAGLAVAATDTRGQRSFAEDIGEGAFLFTPGDIEKLAAGLARWATDKAALERAKAAAWSAAQRRWHWEHKEEREQLLSAMDALWRAPAIESAEVAL